MILSEQAINNIKSHTRCKTRLALEMGKSIYTITKWIQTNDDNLTKAAALKVIREETGMLNSQILEKDKNIVSVV